MNKVLLSLLAAAAVLLGGCASVRPARMQQPPTLAAVPEEPLSGLGWGRQGRFALGPEQISYERSADRLSLFDVFSYGKASLNLAIDGPQGRREARCAARQGELTAGALVGVTKPWTLGCDWSGGHRLQLAEPRLAGLQQAREGSYQRGEIRLSLRSVHRYEGSPLPQQQAVGFELLQGEQVVGSIDLSGATPLLRRPPASTPLGQAVTEAALVLALVWDPS